MSPVSQPPTVRADAFPLTTDGSEEEYKLTAAELTQRLNFENNYCAASLDEAKAKCASTLRTCNYGDPPCDGVRHACFGNVVCSIIWTDVDFDKSASDQVDTTESPDIGFYEPSAEQASPEIEVEDAENPTSQSGSSLSSVNAVLCSNMCLRPLSADECVAASNVESSLQACIDSSIGDVCETAEGGDCSDGYKSNCPGSRNIFVRVLGEQCGALPTNPPADESGFSLSPAIDTGVSPQPSSKVHITTPDGTHDGYDSFGYTEDPAVGAQEVSGNGNAPDKTGWWTRQELNGSVRMPCVPALLITALAYLCNNLG